MTTTISTEPKVLLTLRTWPSEVRDMIFEYTLTDSWVGKTPSLIIALRGDPELYHDALQVFYSTNTFAFTKKNLWMCTIRHTAPPTWSKHSWNLGNTSKTAMSTIKHALIVWPSRRSHQNRHDVIMIQANCENIVGNLSGGITQISIALMENHLGDFVSFPCKSTFQSPLFRHIRLMFTQKGLFERGNLMRAYLRLMDNGFGVAGRPVSVASEGPVAWEWAVDGGRTVRKADLGSAELSRAYGRLRHLGLEAQSQECDFELEVELNDEKGIESILWLLSHPGLSLEDVKAAAASFSVHGYSTKYEESKEESESV